MAEKLDTVLTYANGMIEFAVKNVGDEETSLMLAQWALSWTGDIALGNAYAAHANLAWFGWRNDSGLDDLNDDREDGDAFLFAWVRPAANRANRIVVPVGETRVIGVVQATGTGILRPVPKLGMFSRSGIVGGHKAYNVTGAFGSVTLGGAVA